MPPIPGLRVFVEGVVIVGSILLAFGSKAPVGAARKDRETSDRAMRPRAAVARDPIH